MLNPNHFSGFVCRNEIDLLDLSDLWCNMQSLVE